MKLRIPSYSLPLALLAIAIIAVVLISPRNSADAHGTASSAVSVVLMGKGILV